MLEKIMVKKIMRREALRSKPSPKRKHSKRETAPSQNLLELAGDSSRLNQGWSGDFTYIWTREGWLYLASVMDLSSRRIVGWASGTQATKELVIHALDMGVKQCKPGAGLIWNEDKGSQYTSYASRDALERHSLRQSAVPRGGLTPKPHRPFCLICTPSSGKLK